METKLCVSLCALLLLSFGSADHETEPSPPPNPPSAPGSRPDPGFNQPTQTVAHGVVNDTHAVNQSITPENPAAETPLQEEVNGTAPHIIPMIPLQTGNETLRNSTSTPAPTDHKAFTTTVTPNESHSPTGAPGSPQNQSITSSPDSTVTLDPPTLSTTVQPSEPNTHHVTTHSITASHPTTTQVLVHPKTTTQVHDKPPTDPPSVTTKKSEVHADTPNKLNVKGDTTMERESPPLDPLLAGLVSAFIVTAIIITLLLFLKLRRRDTRPEFRRLQDLPMDDMMEDTPLSMYSY